VQRVHWAHNPAGAHCSSGCGAARVPVLATLVLLLAVRLAVRLLRLLVCHRLGPLLYSSTVGQVDRAVSGRQAQHSTLTMAPAKCKAGVAHPACAARQQSPPAGGPSPEALDPLQ